MAGRASSIQLWQYITAILMIGLLGFHLLQRVPWIWGASTIGPDAHFLLGLP